MTCGVKLFSTEASASQVKVIADDPLNELYFGLLSVTNTKILIISLL
jgi:hypothetical protein